MSALFQGTNWALTLLPEWQGEHSQACTTIYRPENGQGVLQVSAFSKDDDFTDEDLQNFSPELIEAGASLSNVEAGVFNGFTFVYGVGEEFWQYWCVANGQQALFMTYNCIGSDLKNEIADIDKMISSLVLA